MKRTNNSRWFNRYVFEWFTGNTIDEVKKQYKQLVKQYHPDLHTADEYDHFNALMGSINEEYDYIINHWSEYTPAKQTATDGTQTTQKADTTQTASGEISPEMQAILNILNAVDGININIVGSWIWVDGNTRPVKDQLKAAGLKWHSKKVMWFWAPSDSKKRRYRGNTTFEENAEKYGCTSYKSKGAEKIA